MGGSLKFDAIEGSSGAINWNSILKKLPVGLWDSPLKENEWINFN